MSDGRDADPGETDAASDGGTATSNSTGEHPEARRRIDAALREVRREGWKAAVLTALVQAAALFLGANLLLSALGPQWLPERLVVPATVTERVGSALGREFGQVAVPGSATVAGAIGVLAFVVGVWLRVRKPLVEQFEAVNPPVAEKLRTARDAAAADAESRMALRLYEDVLDDLGRSSGAALVSTRRLTVAVAVIAVLSLATVQVAVADLALLDRSAPETDGPVEQTPENYTGLKDADAVLGEREDVEAGENNQTARVESTGGDREIDEDVDFPGRSQGGAGSASGTDGQQAGFASPEQVEDADLVREYNHRIREEDAED